MSNITVERATAADWGDVLRLWAASEVESGHGAAAWTAGEFLGSGGVWVLLARVDGAAAGFAHVCRLPKPDARRGYLFVDELFVHPDHRRRGVGTALLHHLANMSDDLGLAGVRLLVRPENAAARALYRKAEFQEFPTILCRRDARRSA